MILCFSIFYSLLLQIPLFQSSHIFIPRILPSMAQHLNAAFTECHLKYHSYALRQAVWSALSKFGSSPS